MKTKRKILKNRKNRIIALSSSTEDKALLESAKIASSKAVRSSTAMGITIKIIKNNKIIAISPDQSVKILRTISKSKIDTSGLKKGMFLERK